MDDHEAWQRRARSFGDVAAVYERYRPGYPRDAVTWLFGGKPRHVLDLAAGTGKLTEALAGAGHRVVAVEPDPRMRAAFARARPGVELLAGTAETIPLPDDSVDGAAVGQAWHWFDRPRALSELARVLRPGGTLGILWNSRDASVPLVAELGEILEGADAAGGGHGDDSLRELDPGFAPVERATFRHVQVTDVEGLVGLVSSRSHTIMLGARKRADLLAKVEEIARRESRRSRDGTISLPYLTTCLCTRKID